MSTRTASAGRVFVSEPWASLLVTGAKVIETAHIRLPAHFMGHWLDVQAAGGHHLGRVMFKGWRRYTSAKDFNDEHALHLVPPGDRFHFDNRRQTYGWEVARFEAGAARKVAPMRSQYRLELYR